MGVQKKAHHLNIMRPARGTARVNERLTQLLGVPCVGIKAIVDVIAADRGCREHIRAALLQRQELLEHIRAALLQRQELLEPPIANPFPTRPPSTISPKPRQPGFPVAPVPPVRPMPAKPLADLPDVSDDATALSHADVVALVAQLEGASQRAKAGSGAVAGAVGGQTAPSPAAAVPVAAVPVAAPSAAAIAAVPGQSHTAPAAVSVAPCGRRQGIAEALQRRKGLL